MAAQDVYRVIGLMSGTSLDGVDAALLRTDGEDVIERLGFVSIPYDEAFREELRGCFNLSPGAAAVTYPVAEMLTQYHADAVNLLLSEAGVTAADVDLAGFHGQTIAHDPDNGMTWQIGDGPQLAALTGIDVVNDFRSADVKAGGQGAPLAPLYHAALCADIEKPLAVLNLGGVGNVTYIGADGELLAFDTGPGNALIDDWVKRHTGGTYDADGAMALEGRVSETLVAQLASHSWFDAKPPKSLDRNDFDVSILDGISPLDGAATLTGFTVQSVARALDHLPEAPKRWIVCGGGRHNAAIMQGLARELGVPVEPVEAHGWDGDAIEAEAFAWLAVRSLKGLPLTVPGTTGVGEPLTGGVFNAAPGGKKRAHG